IMAPQLPLSNRGHRRNQFRHIDADYCPISWAALNGEMEVGAVQHAEALADVTKADAFDVHMRHLLFGDAHPVIFNLDVQAAITIGGPKLNLAAFQSWCQSML